MFILEINGSPRLSLSGQSALVPMPESISHCLPLTTCKNRFTPAGSARTQRTIFNRAPRHDKSAYMEVPTDHVGVATYIGPALVEWLRTLE